MVPFLFIHAADDEDNDEDEVEKDDDDDYNVAETQDQAIERDDDTQDATCEGKKKMYHVNSVHLEYEVFVMHCQRACCQNILITLKQ